MYDLKYWLYLFLNQSCENILFTEAYTTKNRMSSDILWFVEKIYLYFKQEISFIIDFYDLDYATSKYYWLSSIKLSFKMIASDCWQIKWKYQIQLKRIDVYAQIEINPCSYFDNWLLSILKLCLAYQRLKFFYFCFLYIFEQLLQVISIS